MTRSHEAPRSHLFIQSSSRAEDMGYLAMNDVAQIMAALGAEYRLIGGHMVSHLVHAYEVTNVPGRVTSDADFGAEAEVIADPDLVEHLVRLSYWQESGNRFVRRLRPEERSPDDDDGTMLLPTIDVLAPSRTGSHEPNQAHGALVVDEIPGLGLALAMPASTTVVDAKLTSGVELSMAVALPTPQAALCLKLLAYDSRFAEKDVIDIWRLLAVCREAGVVPADWNARGAQGDAVAALRRLARPGSPALHRAIPDPRSQQRVVALARAVGGEG